MDDVLQEIHEFSRQIEIESWDKLNGAKLDQMLCGRILRHGRSTVIINETYTPAEQVVQWQGVLDKDYMAIIIADIHFKVPKKYTFEEQRYDYESVIAWGSTIQEALVLLQTWFHLNATDEFREPDFACNTRRRLVDLKKE